MKLAFNPQNRNSTRYYILIHPKVPFVTIKVKQCIVALIPMFTHLKYKDVPSSVSFGQHQTSLITQEYKEVETPSLLIVKWTIFNNERNLLIETCFQSSEQKLNHEFSTSYYILIRPKVPFVTIKWSSVLLR